MDIKNSTNQYGIVSKLLHWAFIITFSIQYYLVFRRDYFPDNSPYKLQYILWHKEIGFTLLFVGLFFTLWAILNTKPQYPKMSKYYYFLARFTRYALYGLIILMPLSGFLMSQFSHRPINWFGIVLPNLVPANKALASTIYNFHVLLGQAAIALYVIHILGALKHCLTFSDNVCQRMLSLRS